MCFWVVSCCERLRGNGGRMGVGWIDGEREIGKGKVKRVKI
jgi:hypothetical protein